jgi:hypothetical protein
MNPAAVMAERMARFPGVAVTVMVMAMAVEVVREAVVWSRRWRRNGMEAVGVVVVWTRWRGRRCGKFWHPNDVHVKILRLGLKDMAAYRWTTVAMGMMMSSFP